MTSGSIKLKPPQQPTLRRDESVAPSVSQAMYDVMRFWPRKGVDGFRVDTIWRLIKDGEFRGNPPNPNFRERRPPHERVPEGRQGH
jgi:glycosidase